MYAVDGASGYTATSTGRGTVEPLDCTVDSIAYSIAELQAAAEAQAAAEQAVANAVDWSSLEDSIAELQAAVEAQAAAEQAVANAAAEVAANAAAEAAANAAAEAAANAAAEASQASGGCGPGTVLEGNTCVLAPEESSDGCGQGTVMVNGVCQLAKTSGTSMSIEPLYLIIGVVAIGGIIGAIAVARRGSKTPKPAKQDLEEYEEKYIAKQKPAEKKETSSSCSNCGNTLNPEAKFCGKCGTPKP
jgi:cobalamin biosynthesis Mg chelatase CobN